MKRIILLKFARLLSFIWFLLPPGLRRTIFAGLFIIESRDKNPIKGLKSLFLIKDKLDWVINERALKYGSGIHPKHYLIGYHQFFSSRIKNGSKILDVGCGIGIVAISIAKQLPKSSIIGVDISQKNIEMANKLLTQNNLKNVHFIHGDINDQKDIKTDYVVLSNILEHIENRIDFLKNIQKICNSNTFLIRVPNFERDWQIAMRKELGVYYFSDDDHKIEHTIKQLEEELKSAGFVIKEKITLWGEIWAECEYEF